MSSPEAWIVVEPGTSGERLVPVNGLLLVGRECAGADPAHALIVADPAVSRDHLEIRAGAAGQTTIRDTSSNGTRVNGRRIERSQPIPLADGDTIEIGSAKLRFRVGDSDDEPVEGDGEPVARGDEPVASGDEPVASGDEPVASDDGPIETAVAATLRDSGLTTVAVAVGEIVGYRGLLELHGAAKVASATDPVFAALGELLLTHQGTVSNVAGDAVFAAWDASRDPDAAARAIAFALAADELVSTHPAAEGIPDGDGTRLRMGWAVTLGQSGARGPAAGQEALHGDAVLLAFAVSRVAARDGHAPVLVSARAAASAPRAATYGGLEEMDPEGYSSVTWVRAATR